MLVLAMIRPNFDKLIFKISFSNIDKIIFTSFDVSSGSALFVFLLHDDFGLHRSDVRPHQGQHGTSFDLIQMSLVP